MNWFEEWFDSPLYEMLYANRNEEEAARLTALIGRLMPPDAFPSVLDLGCGRGRHSLLLAEKGYRVTGIDLSEAAIRKARRKAANRNLPVEFLVSDMRVPLDRRFDAVVNLFTSFGYFHSDEENRRVFGSVGSMLRKDGLFFMDYMNADWVRSHFEPDGEGEFREIRYTISRYIEEDVIYKEIRFEGPEIGEPRTYTEQVKLYDLEWFLETFDECGFEIDRIFGNYSGDAWLPQESPRLVMLVRKR